MIEVGQERGFNDLLTAGVHPAIRERIEQRKPRSVFDIGPLSGEVLCLLHHVFPLIAHLEGWETTSATQTLRQAEKQDSLRPPANPYRTLYERYCVRVQELGEGRWKPIGTEREFRRVMKIRFNTQLAEDRPLLRDYDFVIVSNVLHLLEQQDLRRVLARVGNLRKPGSLTYIHTRSRPAAGFGAGNSAVLVGQACAEFAEAWDLRTVVGLHDHAGEHITYTDL